MLNSKFRTIFNSITVMAASLAVVSLNAPMGELFWR